MSALSTWSPLPARRAVRVFLAWLLLAAVVLALTPTTARAVGTASTFVVDASVDLDGSLRVQQTITFSGEVPAEVSQRFEIRENLINDRQYRTEVSEVTASAGGSALTPTVTEQDRYLDVTVPTGGAREIEMSYLVRGAVVSVDSGTALRWRLLQGLSAAVSEFTATVEVPVPLSYVRCTAGSPNSTVPCAFAAGATEDQPIPSFRDGPRGEGEIVAVDIGFPAGALAPNEQIETQWTVGRAFSAAPLPLAIALGLLALGAIGLFLLHRRNGRDQSSGGAVTRVGEFVPTGKGESEFRVVDDVRPGHVGTVADERVDPVDITATIIDLAVRGHLVITEEERSTEFGRTDWSLTRRGTDEGLRPFERALLDGIAHEGDPVRVSDLPSRVYEAIGNVQNSLYDEVVGAGWFERRPDAVRNTWVQVAFGALIIAVVVTGVLAAFTAFGLTGLVLVAIALGLIFVAQEAPSRTTKGAALLAGLGALRADLMNQPTNQMPPGRELQELSEVLPYAVVLGGADRWLDAIAASDQDAHPDPEDLDWYRGPPSWHLADLPDSLRNFVTTVSGTLFAR